VRLELNRECDDRYQDGKKVIYVTTSSEIELVGRFLTNPRYTFGWERSEHE
jgi:hypothetical protein